MDNHARGVRHLPERRGHGGPTPEHARAGASPDRRVQRTRGLLRAALASLVHEKPYDAIVVKEILARANVGRSTFYAHFRDKDELLVSGIREMLGATPTPPTRPAGTGDRVDWLLRFSLPTFEHVAQHRGGGAAADARGVAVLHERLQRVLTELVAADLRRVRGGRPESGRGVPSDLLAEHVAATFVRALNWWAASPGPRPAREGDELFRALIVPALAAALG